MDNPYYDIDREDLEAYRRGEKPPKRKEIVLGPDAFLTQEQVVKEALNILKNKGKPK